MINLESPKKFKPLISQAHQVAEEVLRPNSRKYDLAEHAYPKELDMLAALIDGLNDSGSGGAGSQASSPALPAGEPGSPSASASTCGRRGRTPRPQRRAASTPSAWW